jgi:hypothetical protein
LGGNMSDTGTQPMTDIRVLCDLLSDFMKSAHREVEGLAPSVLAWKPDSGANNIAVTMWHVARWMDILGTRILQGRAAGDEQWFVQGWAGKTGYDPQGIGHLGLGAITGYSLQEAAAVPELNEDELLKYLDEAYAVVENQLRTMPLDMLYEPVPDSALEGTVYDWLRRLLRGFLGHIGEIQALKGMQARIGNHSAR